MNRETALMSTQMQAYLQKNAYWKISQRTD